MNYKVVCYSKSIAFIFFTLYSCSQSPLKNDDLVTTDSTFKNQQSSDTDSAFVNGLTTSRSVYDKVSAELKGSYELSVRLTTYIPDYNNFGESDRKILADRLSSAVSKVGVSGAGANPRYIIGADINLLSKNVTSTAPTKYANTYEVNFVICDVLKETIFGTYSFQIKGVGDSPEKAFINGFRDFKFETDDFYQFLVRTEKKMLDFFEKNCKILIAEADAEAQLRNYDAAFTILNSIPMEASACYMNITQKKVQVFQLSLNSKCQSVLAAMKSELGKANDASASGFNELAMGYFQMIDRNSSCFPEAEKIYQSYLKKLDPKGKRDWDLAMRQYQDKIIQSEKYDQFKRDSMAESFSYLKLQNELKAKAEIEGNKKLLNKYQYDELPWIRKIFHLGNWDPFDRIEN